MILLVLISLVARVAASPADPPGSEAIRDAERATGVDRDGDDVDLEAEEIDEATDEIHDAETEDGADGLIASDVDRQDAEDNRDVDGLGRDDARDTDDPGSAGGDAEDRDGLAGPEQILADDDPDRIASAEDAASDAGAALAGHVTGELAMLVDDAGGVGGDDVSFAAASAGAAETYESWMRHQRPSRWGRLDVGVQWQRRWSEPQRAPSRRYDEVWLVATWRR